MRKLIILAFFLFAANFVFAAEVGLEEAKNFARRWRGKNVSVARTHKAAAGENRFHVVSFEGGGWAAVGVDDEEAPVIAFSDNGEDLVEDEKNPVWFLVKRDAEGRAAARREVKSKGVGVGKRKGKHKGWESVKVEGRRRKVEGVGSEKIEGAGSVKTATVKTSVGDSGLSEICVAPMLKSTWDQKTAGGYKTYNYFTPNNYYCGCVATMMAQMLRYFEFPQTRVTAKTFPCKSGSNINDSSTMSVTNCVMKGGVYDWSKMDLKPNASTPDVNRQEIGKLCYDVGVSVNMMWSGVASGAFLQNAREAFIDTWGYSNASVVLFISGVHDYSEEEFKTIVISNCEAGLPVGYGISGSSAGGHAVVIDGYGYSGGGFYVHINAGWSGSSNAWYCPPDLTMGSHKFTDSDELVYNVYTEGAGAIVTGRVFDKDGNPVEGAVVSGYGVDLFSNHWPFEAITDQYGKYHFKTGIENRALTIHATARYGRNYAERQLELPSSRSMKGYRSSPFDGTYLRNNYSLGNKIDFDFTLTSNPIPKILFR